MLTDDSTCRCCGSGSLASAGCTCSAAGCLSSKLSMLVDHTMPSSSGLAWPAHTHACCCCMHTGNVPTRTKSAACEAAHSDRTLNQGLVSGCHLVHRDNATGNLSLTVLIIFCSVGGPWGSAADPKAAKEPSGMIEIPETLPCISPVTPRLEDLSLSGSESVDEISSGAPALQSTGGDHPMSS